MPRKEDSFIKTPHGRRIPLIREDDGMWYIEERFMEHALANEVEANRDTNPSNCYSNSNSYPYPNSTIDKREQKNKKGQKKEKKKTTMQAETLHNLLGNPGENVTQATANKLGIRMSGDAKGCEGCARAKGQIRNVHQR